MAAGAGRGKADATVHVDGHRIALTNLDKVLYPVARLTKADVIDYYASVGSAMIPHLADRPVTRKRWPDGVDAQPFFEKNLGKGVPSWVRRRSQEHSGRTADYPIVDSPAGLVWLAQLAALELHVPQWYYGPRGARENPDRLVFDLDPGPGATLADCATVARTVRDLLGRHGSQLVPVTSGSKGLHLYLGLNGSMTCDEASDWAHRLARRVEASMPELVVSRMNKSLRGGRILIDWSQNNGSKTTIAPYSLRGRERATVAAPRTWEELEDPDLAQLDYTEVLARIEDLGDPMAALGRHRGRGSTSALRRAAGEAAQAVRDAVHAGGVTVARDGRLGRDSDPGPAVDRGSGSHSGAGRKPTSHPGSADVAADSTRAGTRDTGPGSDRLHIYRSKRSADRTPEPVPGDDAPLPHGDDDTFVIQEHHARRLHFDFRLERGGVLVSWAVPKGVPTDVRANHLAVQTEDHPLEYAGFAGSIPKGEYGGGEVMIWDAGRYRAEKWRDDEVIVVLEGERARGRYVLVRTDGKNWLMHRMKDQSGTDGDGGSDDGGGAPHDGDEAGERAARQGGDAADDPAVTLPSGRARMPRDVQPMLATAGQVDGLGDGVWRVEAKWDGIRAVVELDHGELRVHSRAGNDLTPGYPELAELAEELGDHAAVLDGEIVALAGNGAPRFELLQERMGLTKPGEVRAAARRVPVHYYAFDVLYLDGVSLLGKSYDDRRRLLEALQVHTEHCSVPAQLSGSPDEALAESRRRQLEGIVAKRSDSIYQPGRRSGSWIKVKFWATQDVVVVGWRPGQGRRAGGIGSLLVALPDGAAGSDGAARADDTAGAARSDGAAGGAAGSLRYAGRVGTGFTDAMLDRLLATLKPLQRKTSPVAGSVPDADARDAVWVTPRLVGEVSYSEITRDGKLRQPAWRGLRQDVPVDQVRREG
jgi:bifunctional non-homologous end joining protein LigD